MPKRVSKSSYQADLEARQAERERLISSVEHKLRRFFESDEEAADFFHKMKTSNSVTFTSMFQKWKSRTADPTEGTSRKRKSNEPAEQPSKKLKTTRNIKNKEIKGIKVKKQSISMFLCKVHKKNILFCLSLSV